jgi:hypothetical protein
MGEEINALGIARGAGGVKDGGAGVFIQVGKVIVVGGSLEQILVFSGVGEARWYVLSRMMDYLLPMS